VVLPKNSQHLEARALDARTLDTRSMQARGTITVRPTQLPPRPVVTTMPSGRQAMNLSTSSLY
jgi:hypothetical protein